MRSSAPNGDENPWYDSASSIHLYLDRLPRRNMCPCQRVRFYPSAETQPNLFSLVCRHLPPIYAGVKWRCFSTQYTPDILVPSILSRAQKRTFHPYTCARSSNIWPTRTALLGYERALELEAQVDALNSPLIPNRARSRSVSTRLTSEPPLKSEAGLKRENPLLEDDGDVKESQRARCAREVLAVFEEAYAEWKALGDINSNPRPRGLERFDRGEFTGTHIHIHIVLMCGHLHRLCPHPHCAERRRRSWRSKGVRSRTGSA